MIDIRLQRLTIFTADGRRVIEFADGLNVVVGPYGSGKTSLLELIKYALGGGARLSEAVEIGVSSVVLEVALQGSVLAFERDIGGRTVRVTRGSEPEALLHATSSRAKGAVLASRFLLEACGVPVMRVRRSRTAASVAQEPISFWDLYRYAYVSQSDMGQSIAGHADSQLDRKRRRAFELMFGLLDARSADLETEEAELVAKIAVEEKRLSDVTAFLEATDVPGRAQALALLEQAQAARSDAIERLRELRSRTRSQTDDIAPEQDAVGALHRRVSELDEAASSLRYEITSRRRLASQITLEIEGLQRAEAVSRLVGPIDFTTCPRCLQAVSPDRASDADCYVCLQLSRAMPPRTMRATDGRMKSTACRPCWPKFTSYSRMTRPRCGSSRRSRRKRASNSAKRRIGFERGRTPTWPHCLKRYWICPRLLRSQTPRSHV